MLTSILLNRYTIGLAAFALAWPLLDAQLDFLRHAASILTIAGN